MPSEKIRCTEAMLRSPYELPVELAPADSYHAGECTQKFTFQE